MLVEPICRRVDGDEDLMSVEHNAYTHILHHPKYLVEHDARCYCHGGRSDRLRQNLGLCYAFVADLSWRVDIAFDSARYLDVHIQSDRRSRGGRPCE